MQSFSLRGLLQKEPFWCCFPSPSVQPAAVEGLCLVGGRGRDTDALRSSACPPGDELLPLLSSRQCSWDERLAGAGRETLCAVPCKEPECKSCSAGQ